MGDNVADGAGIRLVTASGVGAEVAVGQITGVAGGADEVPRAYQI